MALLGTMFTMTTYGTWLRGDRRGWVDDGRILPPEVVKCAKEAVRYGLRAGRPIWTADYDKRCCFSASALRGRIGYVERHNTAAGLAPRPWEFIVVY